MLGRPMRVMLNMYGITIDLGRLREVEVFGDRKAVRVGAGNTWGDVYRALEPMNLTVVGGRVDSVAVGGLTLGGNRTIIT